MAALLHRRQDFVEMQCVACLCVSALASDVPKAVYNSEHFMGEHMP